MLALAAPAFAETARGRAPRRIRALPREQRSALLRPEHPRRSGQAVHQRQEHDSLQDAAETTRASRSTCMSYLKVEKIVARLARAQVQREMNAVFIDFPETLQRRARIRDRLLLLGDAGADRALRLHHVPEGYGRPRLDHDRMRGRRAPATGGRTRTSGGMKSRACGSASPIPNGLMDVSNGAFLGKTDLARRLHALGLDGPATDQQLRCRAEHRRLRALRRSARRPAARLLRPSRGSRQGEAAVRAGQADARGLTSTTSASIPFEKDGYKLIQVPYSGMEHQSAVAYGNHFANSYYRHATGRASASARASTSSSSTRRARVVRQRA